VRHTAWTFGELPELLEIRKAARPDWLPGAAGFARRCGTIEVFDEPDVAAAKHRCRLRRLFALQIKDALKYLEKNVPDLQKMAVTYMQVGKNADGTGSGGTLEELREQIILLALWTALFYSTRCLPTRICLQEATRKGRGRLTLICTEVARLAAIILARIRRAARKIKDTKNAPDATADAAQQLARLMPKSFLSVTPWGSLQHFVRYQKAITARLDKYRADPARDAQA
jgi:ATP-dependent helicase HrpA